MGFTRYKEEKKTLHVDTAKLQYRKLLEPIDRLVQIHAGLSHSDHKAQAYFCSKDAQNFGHKKIKKLEFLNTELTTEI